MDVAISVRNIRGNVGYAQAPLLFLNQGNASFREVASQAGRSFAQGSYLSQSELPLTFGVGRRDRVERVVVTWPNGRTEEFKDVVTGKAYDCVEAKGIMEAR